MHLAFVFILIGFGTKTGLFPMHAWLPDAHSEAPSPVSALLSAVLLNCALLIIIRYYIIIDAAIGTDSLVTYCSIFWLPLCCYRRVLYSDPARYETLISVLQCGKHGG